MVDAAVEAVARTRMAAGTRIPAATAAVVVAVVVVAVAASRDVRIRMVVRVPIRGGVDVTAVGLLDARTPIAELARILAATVVVGNV